MAYLFIKDTLDKISITVLEKITALEAKDHINNFT